MQTTRVCGRATIICFKEVRANRSIFEKSLSKRQAMASAVDRAVRYRRSNLTNGGLPAFEPALATLTILADESLWIDSQNIPRIMTSAMRPIDEDVASNANAFYNSNGVLSTEETRDAVVQKRVRILLEKEANVAVVHWKSNELRLLIHENLSIDSGALYRAVVERKIGDDFFKIADHLWEMDFLSGVVKAKDGFSLNDDVLFLSGYFYKGRVGIPREIADATTDDIPEGAVNRYLTRESLTAFLDETHLSVSMTIADLTSDDLTEGLVNKYATQSTFNSFFASKTLSDLPPSSTHRAVTASSMGNLHLSVGGVPEIQFDVQSPEDRTRKLYVQQSAGEDVLFFGDTALRARDEEPHVQETLGEYHGSFHGPTAGVHSGDVIGNVSGMVSDISNHRIINAKLLGNGEGHWVGTVNADVVGKFEGAAKIVTGSVDNVSHVTIGTFDATASVHVKAKDQHLQLTEASSGASAVLECLSSGSMKVSCSALISENMICESLACNGSIKATNLQADYIQCVGISNSFYGIFEVGRLEDVSQLLANNIDCGELSTASSRILSCSCENLSSNFLSVGNAIIESVAISSADFGNARANDLSVASFHVENLSFDAAAFLDNPNLVFNSLSVASASLGNADMMNLNVEVASTFNYLASQFLQSDEITVKHLNFTADAAAVNVPNLSVNSLHAVALEATSASTHVLSTQTMQADAVQCGSVSSALIAAGVLSTGNITSEAFAFDDGVARSLSVSECHTSSLSASLCAAEDMFANACSVGHAFANDIHVEMCSVGAFGGLSVSADFLKSEIAVASFLSCHSIDSAFLSCGGVHSVEIVADAISVQGLSTSFMNATSAEFAIVAANVLSVSSLTADTVSVDNLSVAHLEQENAVMSALSVSHAHVSAELESTKLSCSLATIGTGAMSIAQIHNLSSETALVQSLSVQTISAQTIEAVALSVEAATIDSAIALQMSCSSLSLDDFTSPRGAISLLSVHTIVGVSLSSDGISSDVLDDFFLSVNELIDDALDSRGNLDSLQTLSCASATISSLDSQNVRVFGVEAGVIQTDHLSVQDMVVSSLSVATLHGVTLTQDLEVTALVSQVSTSSVTCAGLSCSVLHVDSVVRSIPHLSDTSTPAVLTTTNGFTDFSLFSEDAAHNGDFVIDGSLYVTDTIFMGSDAALTIENVQHMTASRISVGTLEVGILTGIGGGELFGTNDLSITDVVGNFLSVSPHDTVHEGNMQIDGNLLVSGVVLTGATNRLLQNTGSFEMSGDLSVAGDLIAAGDIVATTVRIGQLEVDMLSGIGTGNFAGHVSEAIANVLSAGGIDDTIHTGNFQIDGNLVVSGAILTGSKNKLLHDVNSYELEGTLSVAGELVSESIVTSKLRVAELEIDMISGIGFGNAGGTVDSVIDNLLSVADTDIVYNGNMQIEGNLVVSGAVLTGAHNKLQHEANALEIAGALSVSHGIFVGGDLLASDGSNVINRLTNTESQLLSLGSVVVTDDVILNGQSLLERLTQLENDLRIIAINS
tara:strand:- start:41 stop:4588 length:4548 start_codon:yes stop_codon:yes gene_type:complete